MFIDNRNHLLSLLSLTISLVVSILSQINRYIVDKKISFILQISEIALFGIMIIVYIFNRIKYQKNKKTSEYLRNVEIELTNNKSND